MESRGTNPRVDVLGSGELKPLASGRGDKEGREAVIMAGGRIVPNRMSKEGVLQGNWRDV